jgi:hypothetical protein
MFGKPQEFTEGELKHHRANDPAVLVNKPVSEWSDVAKECIFALGTLGEMVADGRVVDNTVPPGSDKSLFMTCVCSEKMRACYVVLKKSGYKPKLTRFMGGLTAAHEGMGHALVLLAGKLADDLFNEKE